MIFSISGLHLLSLLLPPILLLIEAIYSFRRLLSLPWVESSLKNFTAHAVVLLLTMFYKLFLSRIRALVYATRLFPYSELCRDNWLIRLSNRKNISNSLQ